MPLFGRKKTEERGKGFVPTDRVKQFLSQGLPEAEIIDMLSKEGFSHEEIGKAFSESFKTEPKIEPAQPEVKPKPKEPEKPMFAPLFVKIDRYRQILNSLSYLKNTMVMLKNSFYTLSELKRLEEDNLKMIQDTIEKINEKLLSLDSEFLRPSEFREEIGEIRSAEDLSGVLADLKSQVEQLKSELQSLS
jgi:DNA-binding transcriptional MerR regulator